MSRVTARVLLIVTGSLVAGGVVLLIDAIFGPTGTTERLIQVTVIAAFVAFMVTGGPALLDKLFRPAGTSDRLASLRVPEMLDALLKNAGLEYDPYGKLPDRVREALRSNRKIDAIRLYREASGAGLKTAKDFIEDMMSPERQVQMKLDALLKHPGIPHRRT